MLSFPPYYYVINVIQHIHSFFYILLTVLLSIILAICALSWSIAEIILMLAIYPFIPPPAETTIILDCHYKGKPVSVWRNDIYSCVTSI